MNNKENSFDLIIIGSGPAGMSAALYASRASLNVLIIEKNAPGGQMLNTSYIQNYPGFKEVDGATLAYNMYEQIQVSNVKFAFDEVVEVTKDLEVICKNNTYNGKDIIIATGTSYKKIGLDEEDKYIHRGISYCAICDGGLYKGKDVLVIGGGDSALKESLYLSSLVNKVYLIHRREEFRGSLLYVEKIKKTNNIEIITPVTLSKIEGNNHVESVTLSNGRVLNVEGIFPYIGTIPTTYFVDKLDLTDDTGHILVNEHYETKINHIFAIGDVIKKDLRQIVSACADGAIASQYIVDRG